MEVLADSTAFGKGLLTITLYVVLAVGIVLLAIGCYVAFGSWVAPRVERLRRGHKLVAPRDAPCCPPGLGCNDPDQQYRVCRRQKARQVATFDEHDALEEAWANYHSIPVRSVRAKHRAHDHFASVRDAIIARALRDTFQPEDGSRRALLQSGEVVGKGNGYSEQDV